MPQDISLMQQAAPLDDFVCTAGVFTSQPAEVCRSAPLQRWPLGDASAQQSPLQRTRVQPSMADHAVPTSWPTYQTLAKTPRSHPSAAEFTQYTGTYMEDVRAPMRIREHAGAGIRPCASGAIGTAGGGGRAVRPATLEAALLVGDRISFTSPDVGRSIGGSVTLPVAASGPAGDGVLPSAPGASPIDWLPSVSKKHVGPHVVSPSTTSSSVGHQCNWPPGADGRSHAPQVPTATSYVGQAAVRGASPPAATTFSSPPTMVVGAPRPRSPSDRCVHGGAPVTAASIPRAASPVAYSRPVAGGSLQLVACQSPYAAPSPMRRSLGRGHGTIAPLGAAQRVASPVVQNPALDRAGGGSVNLSIAQDVYINPSMAARASGSEDRLDSTVQRYAPPVAHDGEVVSLGGAQVGASPFAPTASLGVYSSSVTLSVRCSELLADSSSKHGATAMGHAGAAHRSFQHNPYTGSHLGTGGPCNDGPLGVGPASAASPGVCRGSPMAVGSRCVGQDREGVPKSCAPPAAKTGGSLPIAAGQHATQLMQAPAVHSASGGARAASPNPCADPSAFASSTCGKRDDEGLFGGSSMRVASKRVGSSTVPAPVAEVDSKCVGAFGAGSYASERPRRHSLPQQLKVPVARLHEELQASLEEEAALEAAIAAGRSRALLQASQIALLLTHTVDLSQQVGQLRQAASAATAAGGNSAGIALAGAPAHTETASMSMSSLESTSGAKVALRGVAFDYDADEELGAEEDGQGLDAAKSKLALLGELHRHIEHLEGLLRTRDGQVKILSAQLRQLDAMGPAIATRKSESSTLPEAAIHAECGPPPKRRDKWSFEQ